VSSNCIKIYEYLVKKDQNASKGYIRRIKNAHDSPIECIKLSTDGKFLASASIQGKFIFIWELKTTSLLQQLQRSVLTEAKPYDMRFSLNDNFLVSSSDSGTFHVFSLRSDKCEPVSESLHSSFPLNLVDSVRKRIENEGEGGEARRQVQVPGEVRGADPDPRQE
jgi:WD40 repeat protein